MLQKDEQITLASKLLKIDFEEAKKYSSFIESNGALRVSVPVKGGNSIIVGNDGTVLFANSSVDYYKHVQEFENGRRTPLEEFSM